MDEKEDEDEEDEEKEEEEKLLLSFKGNKVTYFLRAQSLSYFFRSNLLKVKKTSH